MSVEDFERVYEPQEDTWLFCDALAGELPALRKLKPSLVLEVGPGTGAVSTFLLKSLGETADPLNPGFMPLCLAVDINAAACDVALRTARANLATGAKAVPAHIAAAFPVRVSASPAGDEDPAPPPLPLYEAVNGDLLLPLLPRLEGKVDILLFNAPYVPTPDEEIPSLKDALEVSKQRLLKAGDAPKTAGLTTAKNKDLLAAAWAGGDRGRLVTDRMLPLLVRCLSKPRGVAYLVLVEDNEPEEIMELLSTLSEGALLCKIIKRRKAVNEELLVMRVRWKPAGQPQKADGSAEGTAGAGKAKRYE